MNDIEIIDNFLDFSVFKNLQSLFCGQQMIWYYNDQVVSNSPDYNQTYGTCDELDNHQMVHTVYDGYSPRSEILK